MKEFYKIKSFTNLMYYLPSKNTEFPRYQKSSITLCRLQSLSCVQLFATPRTAAKKAGVDCYFRGSSQTGIKPGLSRGR